MHNMVISYIGV